MTDLTRQESASRECGAGPVGLVPGPASGPDARADATRRHLRGSNLLLLGRLISLGINLLVNVLIVRYLTKGDYGAFAYGLAIAAVGANLLLIGMPRAVARFAPLYQERGELGAMFGSLLLSTALVTVLGVLGLVLVYGFQDRLPERWVTDPLALQLTMVLIALAPLHALDSLFESMLAVFAEAGALFLRRYVLGPLLRLGAVLLVMLWSGGAYSLAWSYLGASVLGVLLYGPLLWRALRRARLLHHFDRRGLSFRWREILGYGLPLVVADVMQVVRAPVAIVLLETLRDTREIADLNAFLRISGLNLIVIQSMRRLFIPLASRMLAHGQHDSIDDAYWQTTIWISLLTFPIFLPCIVMPETVALVIYGPGYATSSAVLVVLAVGDYLNAALGLNTYTLNVYARVRFVVVTTCLATLCGLLLAWLLVPAHGALGAAAGLSAALVLQNALHHWGMQRYTPVELRRWKYLGVYATQVVGIAVLLALDAWLDLSPLTSGLLMVLLAVGLLRLHRETMNLAGVLPELARVPLLGRLLVPAPASGPAAGPRGGALP